MKENKKCGFFCEFTFLVFLLLVIMIVVQWASIFSFRTESVSSTIALVCFCLPPRKGVSFKKKTATKANVIRTMVRMNTSHDSLSTMPSLPFFSAYDYRTAHHSHLSDNIAPSGRSVSPGENHIQTGLLHVQYDTSYTTEQ